MGLQFVSSGLRGRFLAGYSAHVAPNLHVSLQYSTAEKFVYCPAFTV